MTIDSPAAAASDAPVRPIREWHALTAEEQSVEWMALVSWVTWIHDLYELSREERLPLCWPQHPGLVEELRSLKFWRDVIYTSRDSGGAHSPRSWHGELRQTLAAVGNFWAPTCRAGHTSAALLSEAHPDLAQRWHAHGPPLMASSPALGAASSLPDMLADAEMAAALDQGEARPHSRSMPYYAHSAVRGGPAAATARRGFGVPTPTTTPTSTTPAPGCAPPTPSATSSRSSKDPP